MVKSLEFERYEFKQIKQDTNETFDSFVGRLFSQSRKCHFSDTDSQMKDQIIEKCRSRSLRFEAFENSMTLDQLISKGRSFEVKKKIMELNKTKNLQQESLEQSSQIDSANQNSICRQNEDRQGLKNRNEERQTFCNIEPPLQTRQNYLYEKQDEKCNRCGFSDHFYMSSKCPARREQCGFCRKFGHYSRMCYDMNSTRKRPHRDESVDRPIKLQRYSSGSRSSSQDKKISIKNSLESENTKKRDHELSKNENAIKISNSLHSNSFTDSMKFSNSEEIREKETTSSHKSRIETDGSVGRIRIKSVQSLLSPLLGKSNVECQPAVK